MNNKKSLYKVRSTLELVNSILSVEIQAMAQKQSFYCQEFLSWIIIIVISMAFVEYSFVSNNINKYSKTKI